MILLAHILFDPEAGEAGYLHGVTALAVAHTPIISRVLNIPHSSDTVPAERLEHLG